MRRTESGIGLSATHRADPVEQFDACGHPDQHRRDGEKGVARRAHSDREHVIRSHAQEQETAQRKTGCA